MRRASVARAAWGLREASGRAALTTGAEPLDRDLSGFRIEVDVPAAPLQETCTKEEQSYHNARALNP